jgi:hypothetical protein
VFHERKKVCAEHFKAIPLGFTRNRHRMPHGAFGATSLRGIEQKTGRIAPARFAIRCR